MHNFFFFFCNLLLKGRHAVCFSAFKYGILEHSNGKYAHSFSMRITHCGKCSKERERESGEKKTVSDSNRTQYYLNVSHANTYKLKINQLAFSERVRIIHVNAQHNVLPSCYSFLFVSIIISIENYYSYYYFLLIESLKKKARSTND